MSAADPTKAWEMKSFKHDRILTTCRFAEEGKSLLAGSFDGRIHRWTVETGEHAVVGVHPTWVTGLIAGPSGRVYSADLQGGVRAWESGADAPKWTIEQAHPSWLRAFALSPDGSLLATGGRDAAVRLWSAETGKLVRELRGHGRDVYCAAFHPDGRSLATGDYDGKILHWSAADGKLVRTLDGSGLVARNSDFLCDVGGVRALAFDAAGLRLAASGLQDAKSNTFCPGLPAAILYSWESGKETGRAKVKEGSIDGAMTSIRFLPDGTLVGCGEGAGAGAVWFWKPGEADPFHVLTGQSAYEVDIHPDGQTLAAAFFEPIGPGGNGNGKPLKKGEYVSNGGKVRVYGLFAKPAKK